MILVDTSIWVDHLRTGDRLLASFLDRGLVLTHPFVVTEIALGSLSQRGEVLRLFKRLPAATVATNPEVLAFIEGQKLFGRGIGFVDSHLLAAAKISAGASLWTRDRRLHGVAMELGLAMQPA